MYYLDLQTLYKHTEKESRVAVRKQINGKLRDYMMEKRLREQRGLCFFCGTAISMDDHLDHLIPVYYGGTNRPSNLVGACRDCNLVKFTDQIEITNPNTIIDYKKLIEANDKHLKRVEKNPRLKRYVPKRARLYNIYNAHLFKELKIKYIK